MNVCIQHFLIRRQRCVMEPKSNACCNKRECPCRVRSFISVSNFESPQISVGLSSRYRRLANYGKSSNRHSSKQGNFPAQGSIASKHVAFLKARRIIPMSAAYRLETPCYKRRRKQSRQSEEQSVQSNRKVTTDRPRERVNSPDKPARADRRSSTMITPREPKERTKKVINGYIDGWMVRWMGGLYTTNKYVKRVLMPYQKRIKETSQ